MGISLVAVMTDCQTRSGLRPRVPGQRPTHNVLPGVARRGRGPRRVPSVTLFRGSIPFTAGQPALSIRPRLLSVYASTCPLPDTLQHSIRSGGLDLTPAGFTPACHDTISRTHRPTVLAGFRNPMKLGI